MFKNAGSTLDWSLGRCFGTGFADHRDDEAMRKPGDYLATYLNRQPQLQALSSHWLPLPPPVSANIKPRLLLLLRNPLERSRSVYNFERTQEGANSAGNHKARELSFTEYVKWRLMPATGPALKNFHTRYCSGDYFGRDMGRLYAQAEANLESIPLVGLVHRYSESMVLFESALKAEFPTIDLSWRVQNASQAVSTPVAQRVDSIAAELGDTFEALIDENQYDMKLLQYAEEKFERELRQIPDLDVHVQNLVKRNELLP